MQPGKWSSYKCLSPVCSRVAQIWPKHGYEIQICEYRKSSYAVTSSLLDYVTGTTVFLCVDGEKRCSSYFLHTELTAHYVVHIGLDASKPMARIETPDGLSAAACW